MGSGFIDSEMAIEASVFMLFLPPANLDVAME